MKSAKIRQMSHVLPSAVITSIVDSDDPNENDDENTDSEGQDDELEDEDDLLIDTKAPPIPIPKI